LDVVLSEYIEGDIERPSANSLKPVVTYSPLRSSVTDNAQPENSLGHGFNYAGLKRLHVYNTDLSAICAYFSIMIVKVDL